MEPHEDTSNFTYKDDHSLSSIDVVDTNTKPDVEAPYVFVIENKSNNFQHAILFGRNIFLHKENFGSDEDIVVTSPLDVDYEHVLNESSEKNFTVGFLRIQTDDEENIKNKFEIIMKKGNGTMYTCPVFFQILIHPTDYKKI